MAKFSILAITVFLTAVSWGASADCATLDVTGDTDGAIGNYMEFFPEEDGAPLTLDGARSVFGAGLFRRSTDKILSSGINAAPVWLRIPIENPTDSVVFRRLSIETSWLDRVDVYFLHGGTLQESYSAGDTQPFSARPIDHRFFVFDHGFAPGTTTVFIRVETPDPMVLPVYLTSIEAEQAGENLQGYTYGFLYGVIFALLAYNLMLYFSLRNDRYLYYALYLFSFLITNASYTGHGFKWLWPDWPTWQQWLNPVLMVFFAVSGLIFATRFLRTKRHFPRLHRAIISLCAGLSALVAFAIIIDSQVFALLVAFSFITSFSFIMVFLGAISLYGGNKSAKYFLIASITAVVSASVTALAVWGSIPFNNFTYRIVDVGIMAEAVLLALALADQFRISQEERHAAKMLARIDPLTGLNNRRAFYEFAEPLYNNCIRKGHDMSVVLMDIDRFKSVNDNFGHAMGDLALVSVAEVLKKGLRSGDVLARWGGEEFILFLPETELDEATVAAERFREMIRGITLEQGGEKISFTASFGVTHMQRHILSLDKLISVADGFLYKAKAQGRDSVCSGLVEPAA